jgi:hypothetical protein
MKVLIFKSITSWGRRIIIDRKAKSFEDTPISHYLRKLLLLILHSLKNIWI